MSRSASHCDCAHTSESKPLCAHAVAVADARASVNDAKATDAVSAVARRDVRIARDCDEWMCVFATFRRRARARGDGSIDTGASDVRTR